MGRDLLKLERSGMFEVLSTLSHFVVAVSAFSASRKWETDHGYI